MPPPGAPCSSTDSWRGTAPRARLACSLCGEEYADGAESHPCARCGDVLEVRYPEGFGDVGDAARRFRTRKASLQAIDRSGVWRFRELLPIVADELHVVTLEEGNTPEFDAPRASKWSNAERLRVKHLGLNPTGSYKDAGMTAAISRAVETGARAVACASTGNTSASLAVYAARAGLPAMVLLPLADVSESKLVQAQDAGARIFALDADFDVAMRLVAELAQRGLVYLVNSLNPYRREGQKTVAFEILEARGWRAPDWVIVPGGNLGHCTALGKGFREAHAVGLADRVPRLAVVQAKGAAPLVSAWERGAPLQPVKANTFATAIKIGNPVSWRAALRALSATAGAAVAVEDSTIAEARAILGRDGLGCEPASAATIAGLRMLRSQGTIGAEEEVVALLTGSGLKDPASAIAYHRDSENAYANAPVHIEADVHAVARVLETHV